MSLINLYSKCIAILYGIPNGKYINENWHKYIGRRTAKCNQSREPTANIVTGYICKAIRIHLKM